MYARWNTFLCVAEEKSLTRAAQRLGYTQSGVSHLISALEEEVQLQLFIRHRNGTELTAEGKQLLPYARRLVSAAEDMSRLAANLKGLEWGKLRIGSFSSVTINWLPDILQRFGEKYPRIEIEVRNGAYSVIEAEVAAGRTDCSFLIEPSGSQLSFEPICEDRYFVILPADDSLAEKKEIDPQALSGRSFIVPAEGTQYDIGRIFAGVSGGINSKYDMGDDYAAVEMVKKGFGFTILPELLLKTMPLSGLQAVPLEKYKRIIGIATGKGSYRPQAVTAFIQCVKEYLAKEG